MEQSMSWTGNAARKGEMRSANKVLVGKPEGKRQECRLEDNITTNIK